MTRSELTIAGGKSQQFATLRVESVFDFFKPPPPLSKFIDNFWLYEGTAADHKVERILPTGTLELAINLREDALGFYDPERRENSSHFSGAVISGAHGCAFAPQPTEQILIIGVHFKPGGAFPFLGVPAGELAGTHVDLETLWGSSTRFLRERLGDAKTNVERFNILQEFLFNRLRAGIERHYAVSAALEIFGTNQAGAKIRDAANFVGLSQRRFIQVFKAEVGMTPKLFSRIQRFQQARIFIRQNLAPDWANIALDFGYFDQSHLIREFQEFSGLTPTDYVTRHKISNENA